MTRTSKPATPAGKPGPRPGKTPAAPKPDRTPAHLPGQPGKGGFDKAVKPVPLPGKSRGR
jgi:hypothetical protein